jgi:hypothetical protein
MRHRHSVNLCCDEGAINPHAEYSFPREFWERFLEKVQYRDEAEVGWLMRTGAGERRVIRTTAELDAAIEESASPRGIYLYVSESLLEETKRRWQEMTRKRKR